MKLDEMVYQRLTTDATLAGLLAKYNNRAAIFNGQAASADDTRWGTTQYPRISFTLNEIEDPAKNSSGVLTVHVWTNRLLATEPETIEMQVKKLLHAVFAKTDDYVYCLAWQRSDAWEIRNQQDESVETTGVTITFDLMASPAQTTNSPDPIAAVNAWTKTLLTGAIVIGSDTFTGWKEPTLLAPVIYWTIVQQAMQQQKHAMTWMDVTIEGHVYARSSPDRLAVMGKIETAAAQINHMTMEDGGPLLIQGVMMTPSMNYLRQGQITIRARYGILKDCYKTPATGPLLVNINAPPAGTLNIKE